MVSHLKKIAIAGLVLLSPAAAHAEGPYYFHKAGIARESYMADVNDCAALSGNVRMPHYNVYQANPNMINQPYGVYSAALAGFFVGFIEAGQRRRLVSRIERTCMADKGYRRRSIEKSLNSEIRKLKGDVKIERLFTLVSAETPIGKVLVE